MKENIEKWVEDNGVDLKSLSDKIWGYAELGLVEHRSAKAQIEYLENQGFKIQQGIGGMDTAFVASWGEGKPIIGYLGEYDALPAVSNEPTPYRSPLVQGGSGHGCGHNLLGVGSLAAAAAVKSLGFGGTVRYYGCPAEESSFGKTWMVREGVFDDVDVALTWHPADVNAAKNSGSLADLVYKFDFFGKTAHAAAEPWNGRSALDGVELMNAGIERMREHMRPENRVHYVISNGGGAPNVVPGFAQNFFDVRAADLEELYRMYDWVSDIAKGAALMTQTVVEPRFLGAAANIILNPFITKLLHETLEEISPPIWTSEELEFAKEMQSNFPPAAIKDAVSKIDPEGTILGQTNLCDAVLPYDPNIEPGLGSTDVGDVSWVVPTAQFRTACYPLGVPGHSWAITSSAGMSIGHKGMLYAAKVLALAGAKFLTVPALVEEAKSQWVKELGGRKYQSPIPDNVLTPPLPFE